MDDSKGNQHDDYSDRSWVYTPSHPEGIWWFHKPPGQEPMAPGSGIVYDILRRENVGLEPADGGKAPVRRSMATRKRS